MNHRNDFDAGTVRRIFEDCRVQAHGFVEGLTIQVKLEHPDLARVDVQRAVVMRIRRLDPRAFDYMHRRACATPRHDRGLPGQLEQIKGLTAELNPWLEQTGQNFHSSM